MLEINTIHNTIKQLIHRKKMLLIMHQYDKKKERLFNIEIELEKPFIWNNVSLTKKITQEHTYLIQLINSINNIDENIEKIIHILKNYESQFNKNIINEINQKIEITTIEIEKLEFLHMFSKTHDTLNCYIDLQSGSGGIDAQDWTKMLLKMYLKWSEKKGFKTKIIEESAGDIAGIKSATIQVNGDYAFGWLRTENGIHRLVRKSPFNANNRRHTSFCSVFIYPELDDKINIHINSSDLRIDVYRASGAGGQHVNRTESAVRITHLPTNTVTQSQNHRSQHKNKEQAMKQMYAKLHQLEIQKKQIKKKELDATKSNISWGNQIRSYILDDSRIKDIRTGIETHNVQSVLNGHLDQFIINNLKLGF
ncbi:peptide chain release factor 2 [Buchnera aphidicola]|uniref:peptide chain release factor 2 n=1 Tax=Buchnera aphidicola TaxID=9 RepID=UPI0031B8156B